jgi:hypothetical protein
MTADTELLSRADRERLVQRLDELADLEREMRRPGGLAEVPEPPPLHRPVRDTHRGADSVVTNSSTELIMNSSTELIMNSSTELIMNSSTELVAENTTNLVPAPRGHPGLPAHESKEITHAP